MNPAARKFELMRVITEFLSTKGVPPVSGFSFHTDLPGDVLTAMVELERLREDSSNPDELAPTRVPLKPRPHLSSGAVALPEPD